MRVTRTRGRALRLSAGSRAGMFVMIALAAVITALAGQVMATALGAPGAGRFAAADDVVRAQAKVTLGRGDNVDTVTVQRPALLPAASVVRVGTVAGVEAATGDIAFPLAVIGRDGSPLPSQGWCTGVRARLAERRTDAVPAHPRPGSDPAVAGRA